MFTFTFTTREEYLAQKKEWFVQYKQTIAKIRARKVALKEEQRGKISWREVYEKHPYKVYEELDELLKARHESRIEANRQYNAQKELKI